MKLNQKGFTLIEVLAVVVILSTLAAIMIPTVNNLIEKNKQDQLEELNTTLINTAKIYMSDNRYSVVVNTNSNSLTDACTSSSELNITSINGTSLTNSNLLISTLISASLLDDNIKNPTDNTKTLDKSTSYVTVKYSCSKKDFVYKDVKINWK